MSPHTADRKRQVSQDMTRLTLRHVQRTLPSMLVTVSLSRCGRRINRREGPAFRWSFCECITSSSIRTTPCRQRHPRRLPVTKAEVKRCGYPGSWQHCGVKDLAAGCDTVKPADQHGRGANRTSCASWESELWRSFVKDEFGGKRHRQGRVARRLEQGLDSGREAASETEQAYFAQAQLSPIRGRQGTRS